MDRRLYEAAQTGNVEQLLDAIKSDNLILKRAAISSTGESALHIACLAGNLRFVVEFLQHGKDLVHELNRDGLSPLHVAAAAGNLEIVKELLKVDLGLCLLKGRENRIPLHSAAVRGRADVVREMLLANVESVKSATSRGETALHLVVRNNQFQVLCVLIEHLVKSNMVGDVINKKDERGDTVLHLAVAKKQHEVVDLLLKGASSGAIIRGIQVNSTNGMGYTPLDMLLLVPSEAGDVEIHDMIARAGGLRAMEIISRQKTDDHDRQTHASSPLTTPRRSYSTLFKYDAEKDKPNEVRDVLLLISILITTATFEAGLRPPKISPPQETAGEGIKKLVIFEAFMKYALHVFLVFNTVGFILSLYKINILIQGFPLRRELRVCMVALGMTYTISLMTQVKDEGCFYVVVLIAVALPLPILALVKARKIFSKMRAILASEGQTSYVSRV